jgi:hypothetical protein
MFYIIRNLKWVFKFFNFVLFSYFDKYYYLSNGEKFLPIKWMLTVLFIVTSIMMLVFIIYKYFSLSSKDNKLIKFFRFWYDFLLSLSLFINISFFIFIVSLYLLYYLNLVDSEWLYNLSVFFDLKINNLSVISLNWIEIYSSSIQYIFKTLLLESR